jgi:hypothetical protein
MTGSATTPPASHASGVEQVDHIHPIATVNVAQLDRQPAGGSQGNVRHLVLSPEPRRPRDMAASVATPLDMGGDSAPKSSVASGGDDGAFNGISSIDMETGGTGSYANTNGTLEPPDQGLCVGSGYVIEAVNDSMRIYRTTGSKAAFHDVPETTSIPLAQFFPRAAGGTTGPTDFISDPRCLFDHATQRWFVTILDLTSVPAYPAFNQDQNFIAVSKTSDPTGDWNIFAFDVTDNGLNGSPLHAGCVGPPTGASTVAGCLGDQPTLGTDANGIYITDNEYAFAEVFPLAPPVVPPLQQIPVLRSGVAQLYALSKQQLVSGSDSTLVRFDTNTVAFPGPAEDSPWQSLSPAQPVANDTTPEPAMGVEYFLSEVGLPVGHSANQVVVWAWTNTASLTAATPSLKLTSVTITTASPSDTWFVPDPAAPSSQSFGAYQKDGPHPLASASGDPEEQLNANDDRMNWVTLSNGTLWTAINTQLSPSPDATGHASDPRVGIMYFQVRPTLSADGSTLQASMLRDGYIQVPDNNVLFGSVAPRVDGATVVSFTLAGVDYYPSQAWARIDGLAPGGAPEVHVANLGKAPEDGFTGLGLLGGQGIGAPDVPPCGPCVARWGDYSATQVDESGCIWAANEYIPTGDHDSLGATDWGTGIYHVCPTPVVAASVSASASAPAPTPASGPAGPVTGAISLPNTAAPSLSPPAIMLAMAALVVGLSAIRRRRNRS